MPASSRAYLSTVSGALGAVFGLYLFTELVQTHSLPWRGALAGAAIGGMIGYFLNACEPFRDGAWLKLGRDSSRGAIAGALGGALGLTLGELALDRMQGGLIGRAISWSVLGLAIGISQGLAAWSPQRLLMGAIGGGLGGLTGGLLFEALRVELGNRYDVSQALGMVALGGGLGLCLALVEQALRRAWILVENGRQEGRAYSLSQAVSRIGLDERAEIGLFGDLAVSRRHAEIVLEAGQYWLKPLDPARPTLVNGQKTALTSPRILRDGDRIELGRTRLRFRERPGAAGRSRPAPRSHHDSRNLSTPKENSPYE